MLRNVRDLRRKGRGTAKHIPLTLVDTIYYKPKAFIVNRLSYLMQISVRAFSANDSRAGHRHSE